MRTCAHMHIGVSVYYKFTEIAYSSDQVQKMSRKGSTMNVTGTDGTVD